MTFVPSLLIAAALTGSVMAGMYAAHLAGWTLRPRLLGSFASQDGGEGGGAGSGPLALGFRTSVPSTIVSPSSPATSPVASRGANGVAPGVTEVPVHVRYAPIPNLADRPVSPVEAPVPEAEVRRLAEALVAEARDDVTNAVQTEPSSPVAAAPPSPIDVVASRDVEDATSPAGDSIADGFDSAPLPSGVGLYPGHDSAGTALHPGAVLDEDDVGATAFPDGGGATGDGDREGGTTLAVPDPAARNRVPRYPSQERRRGHEGVVILEVDVSVEGTVTAVRVLRGSGHQALDREAMRAVERWRFVPALRAGCPVASVAEVPVRFFLR